MVPRVDRQFKGRVWCYARAMPRRAQQPSRKETRTLYRAGNDDILTGPTAFAVDLEVARLYQHNRGFGGPILFKTRITYDPTSVLDVRDESDWRQLESLVEASDVGHPGAQTADAFVMRDDVCESLARRGYRWVRLLDTYPAGAETWVFVYHGYVDLGDEPELEEVKSMRRTRTRPRQNPLLSRPPRGMHGLGVAGGDWFARIVGRRPTAEDYYGVHTSGNEMIAASYALGTCKKLGSLLGLNDPYPVILALDVRGLEELPDVDALAEGVEQFGDSYTREIVRDELDGERGDELDHLAEQLDSDGEEWTDDVYEWIQRGAMHNPVRAIMSAFEGDDEQALDAIRRWAVDGQIDERLMAYLVDQRRYLTDFFLDRVISIDAFKPFWSEIISYETQPKALKRMEKLGYDVFDQDNAGMGSFSPTTTAVWQNPMFFDVPIAEGQQLSFPETVLYPARGKGDELRPQYHGTASTLVQEAFPELRLPTVAPFPIRS
jgi:hypothetical protein